MAKAKTETGSKPEITDKPVSLGALLSKQAVFQGFEVWIVGDTPLITHAWSEKARREMLSKQVKATSSGKEARDPEADFRSSLYEFGIDEITGLPTFGFPATGVKNAILSAAHKDKGLARAAVLQALFIDAQIVRSRPALAGAVCDMPLLRIYGSQPEMREDMVKIGAGLNKVASLAYRGQFTHWAMKLTGKFNPVVVSPEALAFLIAEAGLSCGLGEWRTERKGVFGGFHMADIDESARWEAFAKGEGELPVSPAYQPLPMAAE